MGQINGQHSDGGGPSENKRLEPIVGCLDVSVAEAV
jgi:hypothetical protein